jgi:hypothetical protein
MTNPTHPNSSPDDNIVCNSEKTNCPLGNLVVHVRANSATGPAITNATVNINGAENKQGVTDTNDKAVFNKIKPGDYVVNARKDLYTPDPESGHAQVISGKTTEITLVLKPIAEMHILVGGPYTKDGEVHRYGHTALRIKTSSSDTTYDFGRYGATRGTFGESGDGILRVWSDFSTYIKGEKALKRVTTGFVYQITEDQAKTVNDYFKGMTDAGTNMPNKERVGMKVYKLVNDYQALGPNCTTLSIDGAKKAIPTIDSGSINFNKPEDVLSMPERLALKVKGGSSRLFLPANLQNFLSSSSVPVKTIKVDSY